MKLKLKKWGNSAAVRLPKKFLEELNLKIGDSIDLKINDASVPHPESKPKYKLAYLLSESADGLPVIEEWETMPPVGKEII
ncbi:AbrB/MazE/SpoVT family DNA-binding domain-containing protein [Methyloradius palustris]|uniref:Multidrug transporter MatE n=1 Tax=Methyloradius palustris TaxID=2778876 RepID=A0A8D5GF62_9PROT|nr:AbrB/MazE/SpoVT family DNA-binding domain-containing protein [Methyloradius palustris]BCM25599.1 multidrug transporter MatE [Methyloradius palustris]